jgi:hypothetical protein
MPNSTPTICCTLEKFTLNYFWLLFECAMNLKKKETNSELIPQFAKVERGT